MDFEYIKNDGNIDYNNWNNVKQNIHFNKGTRYPSYKEREIWWANIGLNIGSEVYGKGNRFTRPVLILKKFGRIFFGVPLTSQNKDDNIHFYKIFSGLNGGSWAMLLQVRVFSAMRLLSKNNTVGRINEKTFTTVKEKIKNLYDL